MADVREFTLKFSKFLHPPPYDTQVEDATNMAAQPKHLARAYSQVPITALAFFQSASGSRYILVGEDNLLKIYDELTSCEVGQLQVFKAQPIHGIQSGSDGGPGRLVVWGAAEVAFLDRQTIEDVVNRGDKELPSLSLSTIKAPDWIYDAAVSPYDADSAVLVTAHNEIVRLSFDEAVGSMTVREVISPSRPILYSANLSWVSADCVLVAGGTVFGEILVWKCHLDRQVEDKDDRYEMNFVLTGHEGSIFGVHICNDIALPDGSVLKLLASCSDDRTVRVWDITERSTLAEPHRHEFSAPRETGFGSTPGAETRSKETDKPVAIVMGHASRIWGVKFAPVLRVNEPMVLYSFGEDTTTQKWHLTLDCDLASQSGVTGTLTHQQTFSLHDGKHLWSHALQQRDGKTVIVTGGSDSKVSLIEGSPQGEYQVQPSRESSSFSLQDVLRSLATQTVPSQGRESFSRFDFISQKCILVTTTLGRLLLGTFNPELQWQQIGLEESVTGDLRGCYVLKGIGQEAALLGTTSGNVYHFRESTGLKHIATYSGKVIDFSLLSPQTCREDDQSCAVNILVHIYGVSVKYLLTVDALIGAIQSESQIKELDERFVAVSAANIRQDLLAVGSRHGWLTLLRKKGDEYQAVVELCPRSKDAITAIVPLPPSVKGDPPCYFLTTSRDGKYRIYAIVESGDQVHLDLYHETSPPFGPMIEGAWFTSNEGAPELILYGFRSKNFVIWNETQREELAAVDCGGAHRAFTLSRHPTDPYQVRFAFTKASQLSVFSAHTAAYRTIKRGAHGREVRAISSNGRYIATGAEDTTIRIWSFQQQETGNEKDARKQQLRNVASMKAHTAGLQRLKWQGDEYLFSSAGNEEFFVWRVRRLLQTSYDSLAVVREAVFDDKSADGDLRILDFDIHEEEADGSSSSSFLITMAMSNSALRTYRYTPGSRRRFQLLARASYTGACLTQTRHLGVDENGLSVLTASTDGHVATWVGRLNGDGDEEAGSYHMVQALPVHQSSVKSLDLLPTEDGYLVVTGGDDNGLAASSIVPSLRVADSIQAYTVASRGIVRKAHAAAINGVLMVRRGDEVTAVSVSNDQRVKTWRVSSTERRIELLRDEYSGVADAGDIDFVGGDTAKVILGGVGVEVWDISTT